MIEQVIVSFVIGALSFCGQQFGKQKEWERQEAEKRESEQLQMIQFLCREKNICEPAVQFASPKPEKEEPAHADPD